MTTSIFSAAPRNSAAAEFRAWGSGLSTAFASAGLVKTADTGQIDWSTVAAPGAATTYMGYEIWRFNDALQSTAPIFFKIEYGSGGSAATNIGIRITIGKGSDGAGTLTGTLLAATPSGSLSASTTPSNWHVSSGDGSMIGFAAAVALFTSGTAPFYLAIERSRNTAGGATGTGLMALLGSQNNGVLVKMINYATGYTTTPVTFPAAVPTGATTPGVGGGGNTPLFTGIATDGMGNFWQPRSFLVGHSADIGQLTQMTVPGYGVYLFHTGFGNFSSSALAQHCGAMAWF